VGLSGAFLAAFGLGAVLASAGDSAAVRPVRDAAARLGPEPQVLRLSERAVRRGGELAAADDLEAAFDQCVTDDMTAHGTPGASVAVALDGVLIYKQGYGVKNFLTQAPVDGDTVFRIGSITKQMTAAAVLQQVEAGAVRLDEPVTRTIPELWLDGPWPASLITVHHLLSQTSGFPDLPLPANGPRGSDALSNWAAHTGAFGLHAPPGSFFNYSNPNFMLAGLVVERASGIDYHTYMATRVWGPAGLEATTLDPSEVYAGGDYSYGHVFGSSGVPTTYSPSSYDNWAGAPAGWAFSTAPDLVKWALLLMDGGGDVLEPESVALMETPTVLSYFSPTARYGYGLVIDDIAGLHVVYHGGNITGWGAIVAWVPDYRFAVAVLANGRDSLMDAAGCVIGTVLPLSTDPPPDVTTDPSTWRRYAGTYRLTDNIGRTSTGTVALDGDSMSITISSPRDDDYTTPMYQYYYDTFVIDIDGDGELDTDFTFVDGIGHPSPVRWLRNRYLVGQRVPGVRGAARPHRGQ